MQMTVIYLTSALLACFPLLMASFFLAFTLPRKLLVVEQDVKKLTQQYSSTNPAVGNASSPSSKIVNATDITELAGKYFGTETLILPALLLTIFYFVFFALSDSFLKSRFLNNTDLLLFPPNFVTVTSPLLYAFVGVYLFNLGTIVRRLYLGDLNEQVFWGALNRTWLSMGLAVVFLKLIPLGSTEGEVYFSIGFLANIFLDWILENVLKLLNITKPKIDDLPLQMVKGINLWKEYRLEEEGIENVQNLATADVVDLAVRTHYNLRTLIDWIDQAILLQRLNADQVNKLASQATSISAIELAAASPEASRSDTVANALAQKLGVDPALMGATMDRLYEDDYVQTLWQLWQSGTEGGVVPALPMRPLSQGAHAP